MSKENKPLYFRILKFLFNFNWYAALVIAGLFLIISLFLFVTGFEPDALHVQIPIKIKYAADENWLQYPDEDRPMILDIVGEANVLVERKNIPYLGMRSLFLLVAFGIYLFGSYHMRQFVKLIDLNLIFTPEMPLRLRYVGLTLFVWGPFYGLSTYLQGKITIYNISNIPEKLSIEGDLHLEFVLIGMVLLAISEIMKIGVKMQKEQSLTV